jgi:membrane protein implicated in regulation of membrane protease activity
VRREAKRSTALRVLGWTVAIAVNLFALLEVLGTVVGGITEGSPAQEGPNYLPPWGFVVIGIVFSIVPAASVILVRRSRKRRATESDPPQLLPESLD